MGEKRNDMGGKRKGRSEKRLGGKGLAKGMIDNPGRSLSVEKSRSLNGVENCRSFPFQRSHGGRRLDTVGMCGYRPSDIEVVAAFDIDREEARMSCRIIWFRLRHLRLWFPSPTHEFPHRWVETALPLFQGDSPGRVATSPIHL